MGDVVKGYSGLADHPKDDRIDIIGQSVMKLLPGRRVGFVVDKEPDDAKAARYIRKLQTKFPEIIVVSQLDGPVENTTTVIVTRKMQGAG